MTSIMYVDPTVRDTVGTTTTPSTTAGPVSVSIDGNTATVGVTLSNVSAANPLPVSFGGSSTTMDVNITSATNGTPINVALPGITAGNPLPVSFPTAGGMNVTVTNPSPIPVSFSAVGGLEVKIIDVTSTSALPVTMSGGSVNAVISNVTTSTPLPTTISSGTVNAVISNVTTATPLPVSFSTAGGMDVRITDVTTTTPLPVTLNGLLAGEDQTNNWLKTADGATQGYHLHPAGSGSVAAVPSETVLGASGASGDYLKKLTFVVTSATNAAAFVCQDGQVLATNGGSGTAPSGTTTIAVTASAAVTLLQNQLAGRVIMITYTPTGASGTVKLRRRIVSHAAFASATALSFTVTHAVPAGGAISTWQVEGVNTYEILPYNMPAGVYQIDLGEVSTNGAWRIAVDSGVSCHAVGKFT